MDKNAELKSVIEGFEAGRIDLITALSRIYELSGKEIDEYSIRNYWTYTSLDNFCDTLLTEPIAHWENIDDTAAIDLIKEILNNLSNDGLAERNSDALEKRYRKTAGFVSELILHKNIDSESDILKELKKDTTIYL